MSLYGALFGGVSGLASQSAKIGMISDNIANVNTIGYKEAEALFETLVVNSTNTGKYSTGGVRVNNRINVDKQGLILSTDAPTDIALSGNGFFTVNGQADSSGIPQYTRAGSFRVDEAGNFINGSGFYLQGWPLSREGLLPGEPGNINTVSFGNLESLETVNVESSSGIALATENMEVSANLDAGEEIYPGEAGTVIMDENNTLNFQIDAETIIVPDEYGLAPANSILRGDSFEVLTGNGLQYQYEYGGFTIGRSISVNGTSNNFGDGLNTITRSLAGDAVTYETAAGGSAVTIDFGTVNHGLITGDTLTIAGDTTGFGLVNPLDGAYTVTWLSATTLQITTAIPHGVAGPSVPAAGDAASTVTFDPYVTSGNMFDADAASEAFFGTAGTTRFTTEALSFSIVRADDTHTFTYTASSPNVFAGQFNSLSTLAQAIDEVNGLTARVAGDRLMVGAEDADEALSFTNGDDTTFTATQTGIDWISELDLAAFGVGDNRWFTMQSLANEVNEDDGVTAEITDPLSQATMDIRVDDPLDTIEFQDVQDATLVTADGTATYQYTAAAQVAGVAIDVVTEIGVDPLTLGYNVGDFITIQNDGTAALGLPATFPNTPGNIQVQVTAIGATDFTFQIPGSYNTGGFAGFAATNISAGTTFAIYQEGNQGSVVAELGLVTSLNSAAYTPQTTGVLGPEYDSTGAVGDNMASGEITPQFSRNVRVYDALGTGHDLTIAYIKTDENEWAVEIYAADEDEVVSSLFDGQVAVGTLTFNGDGSLRAVSAGLRDEFSVTWANGAAESNITIDWGTAGQPFGTDGATEIGDTDGISQFDGDYTVNFINQDGAPVGELVGVEVDEEGFVIASYTNGETRALYKLPIADFTNVNGLRHVTGNVYEETRDSGDVQLREAGTGGAGDVVGAALEQSNVELSEQLTDMIVAQRAYQSNTRVITTTDELLEQLNNI
ncbi:MAG: flagellar hook-basal body complex protein [Rickettsiales bacterium]|nr:flagellar hook-basal body complex protein [Rickettsiales bacterium]